MPQMTPREQIELLHAASCMRAALREMIYTFQQPRFGGAYPECLERSRQALETGVVLDRPMRNQKASKLDTPDGWLPDGSWKP